MFVSFLSLKYSFFIFHLVWTGRINYEKAGISADHHFRLLCTIILNLQWIVQGRWISDLIEGEWGKITVNDRGIGGRGGRGGPCTVVHTIKFSFSFSFRTGIKRTDQACSLMFNVI